MYSKFKLNQFRTFYRSLKTNNKAIDFLIYAFLFWLEEIFIDYKVFAALERALDPIDIPPPSLPKPVYTEELDGDTPLGGEMRLSYTFTHEESTKEDLQKGR